MVESLDHKKSLPPGKTIESEWLRQDVVTFVVFFEHLNWFYNCKVIALKILLGKTASLRSVVMSNNWNTSKNTVTIWFPRNEGVDNYNIKMKHTLFNFKYSENQLKVNSAKQKQQIRIRWFHC